MTASVNNYRIGKGIVYFKKEGGSYVDMGNCPTFEFTPAIEKLEHNSSRQGVKSVDKTVVLSKKGTLKIVLDEWTKENIALALLDSSYTSGAVHIFAGTSVKGSVKIEDSNEVGPTYTWEFLNVEFIPSQALSLISDQFGQIELEGTVQVDATTGTFGTVTDLTLSA
jgi:hypothetical protein